MPSEAEAVTPPEAVPADAKTPQQSGNGRASSIGSAPGAIFELRMCIADLRAALDDNLAGKPIDSAQLLNETTEVALRYDCYRAEAQNDEADRSDEARPSSSED